MKRGEILADTYEIEEEIGAGGGGVIYRAKHLRLNTDVVVKKIKEEVVNKIQVRQEADILKKLKHPYLPRVYDFLDTEDGIYTVMDFVSGINLEDAMKKHGRFSQKEVRKWAEQLGEAVAYLHKQNPPIIHSDIKPANIMLTSSGDICLIDFNIALAMGSKSDIAVGISARYSPPEQYRDIALYTKVTHNYTVGRQEIYSKAKGIKNEEEEDKTEILQPDSVENGKRITEQSTEFIRYMGKGIDTRSDIYSLGVTLYYLLSGIVPNLEFGMTIPLEDTKTDASEGLQYIINKMMELDPQKRYRNGEEYLKDIVNCYKLDHRYIKLRHKQRAMQTLALVCLVTGVALITSGVFMLRKEENAKYYSLLEQAQQAIELTRYGEAEECLAMAQEQFPLRIEAYREQVLMLYQEGTYAECVLYGEKLVNVTPFLMESEADKEAYGDILYILGNAYYEMQDYGNAEIYLSEALAYNTSNALYYRDYAITLARLGKTVEAENTLKDAQNLGMAEEAILMVRAEVAHRNGQTKEAISFFQKALPLISDKQTLKRAILLCADTYKDLGIEEIDEEINLLEQYSAVMPEGEKYVFNEYLADAYVRKAQSAEGDEERDEYYQKALMLFQKNYEKGYLTYQLQENMAILYENLNEYEEAEKILFQMKEQYPERYEVYKRLAFLEADRQQAKENQDREYRTMQEYYEKAKTLYDGKEQDMEMDMLRQMMEELQEGGWFNGR